MNQKDAASKPQDLAVTPSHLTALSICIIAVVVWTKILIAKYLSFGYFDWDFAFFAQATWNLLHGSQQSSIFGINFFGNHSNFIAYLCLPIYALSQHPLTLVLLKVLSYCLGAFVFYWIAKDEVSPVVAIILMILYLIYPPNIFGIIYEFDYESLGPVFLFSLFYFFKKNKFFPFILTAVVTMLIKENMPLIILAFGIYALFCKNKNKMQWGVLPILLGFSSFYLLTSVVIPHFAGGNPHPYLSHYQKFGNSPLKVILSIILNPFQIIPIMTTPFNINLLFDLFSPVVFFPFLSPQILFLTLPIILQHFLSISPTEHVIYYQYGMTSAPFIFLATLNTLAFINKKFSRLTFYILIILCIGLTSLSLKNYSATIVKRLDIRSSPLIPYEWKMVNEIPNDAPVIATLSYLAPLSTRAELYAFHKVYHEDYEGFVTPANVEYALVNLTDPWLNASFSGNPQKVSERLQKFFFHNSWSVEMAVQDVVLLHKNKPNGRKLVEVQSHSFDQEDEQPRLTIDHKIDLQTIQIEKGYGNLLPITFYWKAEEDITNRYIMTLGFRKNNNWAYVNSRNIGYTIYPTNVWKKREHVKEYYVYCLPTLDKGEYTIAISINKTTIEIGKITIH